MKIQSGNYVTCGQMKLLEQRADECGLSYYQMMENAGTGAAAVIAKHMSEIIRSDVEYTDFACKVSADAELAVAEYEGSRTVKDGAPSVLVLCGKGNNGGDGFVIARALCNAGYDVTVVLVDGKPKTRDAVTNFELLTDMNVKILNMTEDERALFEIEKTPDVIADAMYGTGFSGNLKGNGLKAAIFINKYRDCAKRPVVFAVDIPSGAGGDMTKIYEIDENCVRADFTLTFHARKPIHMQSFASKYCGKVMIIDIGIDEAKLWRPSSDPQTTSK